MPKVLMVSGEWLPTVGGIARHVGLLSEGLGAYGWSVDSFDLGSWSRSAAPTVVPAFLRATRRCDVVHSHDLVLGNWLAGLVPRRAVITLHSSGQGSWMESSRLTSRLSRAAARRVSQRIAVSPDTLDYAPRLGGIDYIPNGIAMPPARLLGSRRSERLLFARRLVHKNGLDILLKALTLLAPEERPLVDVTAAGTSSELKGLGEEIATLGLGAWIRVVRPYSPAKWAETMASYRGVALPSRWDAICFGAVEPLSVGTPLIATPFPAMADVASLIPSHLRFVADSMEPSAVADAVKRWTSSWISMDDRRLMREGMSRYSAEAMVDETVAIYGRIVT